MTQPVLHVKLPLRFEGGRVSLQTPGEILCMHALAPAVAELLFQTPPREIEPRIVEIVAQLVSSRHPDQNGRRICDCAETLLRLHLRLFGMLAAGDVVADRDVLLRRSSIVQEGDDGRIHPIKGAIFGPILNLTPPDFAIGYCCPQISDELFWVIAGVD